MGYHPMHYYNDDGTVNTGSTSRGYWHSGFGWPSVEPAKGSDYVAKRSDYVRLGSSKLDWAKKYLKSERRRNG